jgi:dimethylglycine dehydrogenase
VETSVTDYQHMYYCYRPGEQHDTGRPVRTSSIYPKLKALGAQFQQVMGWERPRWFDPSGGGENCSFRRSNWWEPVRDECLAVRNSVGLTDLSTFAKYDVRGRDAAAFLDRLAANAVPRRDGGIALAHLLTDSGRIKSEMTITRLAPDHFFVLSAATAQLQDHDMLANAVMPGEDATIGDVTEAFGCLVLAGPLARDVLGAVTKADLSNAAFPWLTAQTIEVAGVGMRALRVNYVGELGWELHCPMAEMPPVFDALMDSGQPHGLRLFGSYAMNSLRMEKAYRAWGGDLTNEITMIEADMERFVRLDKEFVGRAATLASKQQGPRIKLAYMEVDATDSDCRGNEPITLDGRLVGLTTGGAYGFAVKKSLTFAYLEPQLIAEGAEFDIALLGETCKARIIPQPAYDPANARLKG